MRVYLSTHPRVVAIVSNGYALLLRVFKEEINKEEEPQCIIEFVPELSVDLHNYREILQCHGFLGISSIKGYVFLSFITDRREVGSIRVNERIYAILATSFVCLNSSNYDYLFETEERTFEDNSESPVYSIRRLLATGTFFYSDALDLVSSFQERGIRNKSFFFLNSIDTYDGRFTWNNYMVSELIPFRNRLALDERKSFDAGQFLVTIIRGFARSVSISSVDHGDCLLTIISKQDCRKSGHLVGPYGVDDEGNVTDFVETELIFTSKNHCFSQLQIRGNVPLFWELESQLLSTKIEFPRSDDASKHAFDRHFETIIQQHSRVHVLDCLSSKLNQQELSERYKRVIDNALKQDNFIDTLKYTKIKLSGSLLKSNSFNHSSISQLLEESILEYEALCFDYNQNSYLARQSGIFLTNTLNSMEKANNIQAIISELSLDMFFKYLNIELTKDLENAHQFLWKENGNALIKLIDSYSLYSNKTKKSGGLVGIVAGASKKYMTSTTTATSSSSSSTAAANKQHALKKLLGRGEKQLKVILFDPIHDFIASELKKRSSEFTSTTDLNIFTTTFNVNGVMYDGDISEWIFPEGLNGVDNPLPSYDIIAIGFEELVELTPGKMMNINPEVRLFWERKLKELLSSKGNYILLRGEQLGGIFLLVFSKEKHADKIRRIEGCVRKTGLGGMSSNKGAVAVAFTYSKTNIAFIVSHLAAGLNNVEERHQNYKTISKGLRFTGNKNFKDFDAVIWMGDFNYRIDLTNEVVRPKVEEKDYMSLFEHDQLNLQMAKGETFPYFDEMEIKFPPTYKFNNGTDIYDTSEKMRIPAWTDRIVSRSRGERVLKQTCYGSVTSIKFSDHRPVYATFIARVDTVDETAKSNLEKRLYELRKREIGDFNAINSTDFKLTEMTLTRGLPPPSSKLSKWWLDGGKLVKISFPELEEDKNLMINPKLPKNPFIQTNEPDFVPRGTSVS